jgi:predicted ATPase
MIRLDSLVISNFKNISHADISLNDIVLITGPENSGVSNLLLVFPFLNFIINGTDEDLHSYFGSGEAPDMGSIINSENKDNGFVEFTLKFSETLVNSSWIYNLILSWEKGKRDFIKEENFGEINDTGKISYIFRRNETQVIACAELEVYLNKTFPDSEQSIIRILMNINASLISAATGAALQALDDLLHYKSSYFSGSSLKHEMLISMFGSHTFANDLQEEICRLEIENKNWIIFKTMLENYLGITNIECHQTESKNQATDKNSCYVIFTNAGNEMFFNQLPESSLHLVTLLTRIFLGEHSLFLLEEPEKLIEPAYLQNILEYLTGENFPFQFIISSNSISLINAVLPENILLAVAEENGMYQIDTITNMMNKKKSDIGAPGFGNEGLFIVD